MMNDAATTATSIQSRFCISDERTDGGSCGRGCTGGGVTNWNSTVTSPMTTLPRDSIGEQQVPQLALLLRLALAQRRQRHDLIAERHAAVHPVGEVERVAGGRELEDRERARQRVRRRHHERVACVDCPMVTFSRLRTSRSSTILPFWMMPMRRIFGARVGIFSVWAMSSTPSIVQNGWCDAACRIFGRKSCFRLSQS